MINDLLVHVIALTFCEISKLLPNTCPAWDLSSGFFPNKSLRKLTIPSIAPDRCPPPAHTEIRYYYMCYVCSSHSLFVKSASCCLTHVRLGI